MHGRDPAHARQDFIREFGYEPGPVDLERYCERTGQPKTNDVVHPSHYGGDGPYEVHKVNEAWGMNVHHYVCSAIEYLARFDKKGERIKDLKKARYLIDKQLELEEKGGAFHAPDTNA